MNDESNPKQEKLVSSECSLESEINTARINALELKLETLSIITESLWNMVQKNGGAGQGELQEQMGSVISSRALRDQERVACTKCESLEPASKSTCSHCGSNLTYNGNISPFDY